MIVAGGIYREECLVPEWSRIFGSGGRAAVAASGLVDKVDLHSYACGEWIEDVRRSFEGLGIGADLTQIEPDICFRYLHPLSRPDLSPTPVPKANSIRAEASAVLRFGFAEGDAIVNADRAVYDPQHWTEVLNFHRNGSTARELAIVLNETELRQTTGQEGSAAIQTLTEQSQAAIVVVKRGPFGATVAYGGEEFQIPAFKSESIFKIGSGDVFSAVFACLWAEHNANPVEAAHSASKAVSAYVSSKDARIDKSLRPSGPPVIARGTIGPIYLAGPFFSLSQRWLIEETLSVLSDMGATVFSPLHDVGKGGSVHHIAQHDLDGLRESRAVLAMIDGEDPGTLFEVGYARSRNIPVVAFVESSAIENLTMLEGSGCHIARDYCAAIYHSIWAAAE
ncbi:PfkB family carbohydrate kinase [Dongia sp.]|uniref:PfkB family carbohydrate kinase n=1 Tax=Dongia sp. TaxID=1977262 RepID=UPI003751F94E